MDIAKINFAMTYLTGVAQDWFEVGLNQEDQGILQDWLSDWNLFVDELRRHFTLTSQILAFHWKTSNALLKTCTFLTTSFSYQNQELLRSPPNQIWPSSGSIYGIIKITITLRK